MKIENELPATLPGSIRDQLVTLAPYVISWSLYHNGGFTLDLKIPKSVFLTFHIDHTLLATYGLTMSVSTNPQEVFQTEESTVCGRASREQSYVDVELKYLS